MHFRRAIPLLTGLVFLLATVTSAQQQDKTAPQMIERSFPLQHAEPEAVLAAVRAKLSAKGTAAADVTNRLIIVMDTPETLEAVRELIAEMDVPPDRLLLTFFVFSAKRGEALEPGTDVPKEVKTALGEVTKLMSYERFELLDQGLLTLLSEAKRGHIALSDRFEINFSAAYNPRSKYLHMNDFTFYYRKDNSIRQLMQSDIGIADGEVVIAGVSRLAGSPDAVLTIITLRTGKQEEKGK